MFAPFGKKVKLFKFHSTLNSNEDHILLSLTEKRSFNQMTA
jgi:hypothetical protein